MRTCSRSTARRRGVPLWFLLTALVLLPLLGVGALTATIARASIAEVDSAARAEEAVRAVAQLDAARSGVLHEIVPMVALAAIENAESVAPPGEPTSFLAGQPDMATTLALSAREVTDKALAAVPAGSVGSDAAEKAIARLAELRSLADDSELSLAEVYYGYHDVADDLHAAQRRAAFEAGSEDLPASTLRATRDVETVSRLAQAAGQQLPPFLVAQLDAEELGYRPLLSPQVAWQAYTDAQRYMPGLSQPALRDAWRSIQTSASVVHVDAVLAQQAGDDSTERMSLPDLAALVTQAADRNDAYAGLVVDAVGYAVDLVAVDRQRANDHLRATLLLVTGLLLLSALGAFVIGRTVSRSLGLLASQATRISEGSLIEVEVAGPREVRTVSAALGSAVGSLRRIQDQARAVARGDLADTVLEQPLPGPLGEVVHASVQQIVSSVRAREELQDALAHQATHDALTELPNRAQVLTLVTAALHRARRSGDMTGLLFVDLDGFKRVNDGHGHACGDEVLRAAARRMAAVVRPGDVVGRLGGDEFVVLVEGVRAEADLQDLGDRLIAAVSEPIFTAGHRVRIGASVGVAVSRDGGTDAGVLVAEADTAAYRAKRRGRGRTEMFDEALRVQLHEQAELEAAIAAGLAAGEMQLHYQPVVDVGRDRVIGYEALVRWARPGHGVVPPGNFIPVAESSGLICDLDRWALHEATRQLAEWRAAGPIAADDPEPTIAVNVSGRHLADRRVVQDVADALAASGLPAHLLVLEITETVLLDTSSAIGHLTALREMGVVIAIDDFGTGYTSIGQLRNMPVDTLKIDRSFIASAEPGQPELVSLIIRAAHTFGLTVVAEGVEEPEQLDRLRAEACDQAQGYLLYRPIPAADAGALLRSQSAVVQA
jgi:diguanylate cyclase (GGDEF)-like protein